MTYLQGLPAFAGYFGVGVGFVALYLALYLHFTPHRELRLIRDGNTAAATALAGSLLGFCLPLASAMAHSVSLMDLALWGLVALLAQTAAYALVRLLLPGFPARMERGEQAAALLSATLHLGVGLINAAAMTY
jgi:putative membrane protein